METNKLVCGANLLIGSYMMGILVVNKDCAIVVRKCSSKQVFLKFCNTHRKATVLESLFNKDIKRLQRMCFPVNIPVNNSGGFFCR